MLLNNLGEVNNLGEEVSLGIQCMGHVLFNADGLEERKVLAGLVGDKMDLPCQAQPGHSFLSPLIHVMQPSAGL